MANIILRANIKDKKVNVEYKVLPLPLSSRNVELIISPIQGVSISSKDYSHGLLPSQVRSILFEQLGENVIAKITLSNNIDPKLNQNVALPLMSRSIISVDKFKLIDDTVLDTNNIVVVETSIYNNSSSLNSRVYSGANKPGKKILVLSKTITATNQQYFRGEPSYNIVGNEDRYTAATNIKTNSTNGVISKKFDIYYTSPEVIDNTGDEDIITFSASLVKLTPPIEVRTVIPKEEYEVYSFDHNDNIGPNGGVKTMNVRGVPGTKFKIMLQDQNKKTYNFKTGVFELGGGMFEGTIPPALGRRGYGEYVARAKMPKYSATDEITTNLTVDKPIDHIKLAREIKEFGIEAAKMKMGISRATTSSVNISSSITFSVFSTGFTIPYTNTKGTANLIVGPGKINQAGDNASFSVTLQATRGQIIRIERQPLHSETEAYVNWDSGSDKANALTSTGVAIPNDWHVADAKGVKLNIDAKCVGLGNFYSNGETEYTNGYNQVVINATISNVVFGTGDIELSLDLLNFLTLQSL